MYMSSPPSYGILQVNSPVLIGVLCHFGTAVTNDPNGAGPAKDYRKCTRFSQSLTERSEAWSRSHRHAFLCGRSQTKDTGEIH